MTFLEEQWAKQYPGIIFMKRCENGVGELLTPAVIGDKINKTVYLIGSCYTTIMYAPRLMFHMVSPDHIHIDDIMVKHYNQGNGTIAMKALFDFARKNGVKKITGSLSEIDNGHAARRNHFYEKLGFKVMPDRVEKKL